MHASILALVCERDLVCWTGKHTDLDCLAKHAYAAKLRSLSARINLPSKVFSSCASQGVRQAQHQQKTLVLALAHTHFRCGPVPSGTNHVSTSPSSLPCRLEFLMVRMCLDVSLCCHNPSLENIGINMPSFNFLHASMWQQDWTWQSKCWGARNRAL